MLSSRSADLAKRNRYVLNTVTIRHIAKCTVEAPAARINVILRVNILASYFIISVPEIDREGPLEPTSNAVEPSRTRHAVNPFGQSALGLYFLTRSSRSCLRLNPADA